VLVKDDSQIEVEAGHATGWSKRAAPVHEAKGARVIESRDFRAHVH
jgi:hypothetical protein